MVMVNPSIEDGLVVPRTQAPKEMLSVSTLHDGRTKVRINASSLAIIQECLRKSRYSLHEGWKAQDESPATVFGSAFHAALEWFYQCRPEDRYVPDLDLLLSMGYGHKVPKEETDLILKATRAFVDKAQPLAPLPETDKRSIQNGLWILQHYFRVFRDDPYVAYVDEKGPFVERTFSLVVHEDSELQIELFGTIDFAFRHIVTESLLLGDHKTSGWLNFGDSSYFDREKPNHQYSGYLLGAREVFGLDVGNFMVNIIEVKGRPKTTKGQPPSFPRQITTRTEEDFEEFKETLLFNVRLYLNAIKTRVWPLGPVQSCNSYGKCSFKEVCAAPKSLRENILSSKYVRHS